jgi:hypothetical protein
MKGFISVTRNNNPYLIALNTIAKVSRSECRHTRILLLATDKDSSKVVYAQQPLEEVMLLIEEASK